MKIDLNEYKECILERAPEAEPVLEASFLEASRVMSPQGLHNYLEGMRALCELGKGSDLVITWLEAMPSACKEVGDSIIPNVIESCMKLSSMVSGEVVRLVLDSMPTAARRLGDPELVLKYLSLIHQLSAKVPRGLRPMLERLDDLLSKLTLGGVRRWALWGAQAYGRDFKKQIEYFSLQSPDSHKVLQNERRGTLFIDTQRKINFYLRALWGRDFFLRPTSGDYETKEGLRPYVENHIIHVPDAYDDIETAGGEKVSGLEIYRAACAHIASHIVYSREAISAEMLSPVQMFVIALVEDARIEALAIREFPGLKKLWAQLHDLPAPEGRHEAIGVLEDVASALLNGETKEGSDLIVANILDEFRQAMDKDPETNQVAWNVGMSLYHQLNDRLGMPGLGLLERNLNIPYRDDNRIVWSFADNVWN
ncbi:MAG TPA: VWA domain-containing protein, partial [Guyparkeria sp.]|nr:VWA domain-containing protein [Guyparkeria sp.]